MRLQRLNGDASWWLDLGDGAVVFDPWLVGEQVDGWRGFHVARHTTPMVAPEAVPSHVAVVWSQPFTDHAHLPTVARMLSDVPLCVVPAAAARARRTGRTVHVLPRWGAAPARVGTLRLWRIPARWWRAEPFAAVVVAASDDRAVVHAPHGARAADLAAVADALDVVGFAGPRQTYRLPWWLGGRQQAGAEAAEAAVEAAGATWALPIHQEAKEESGLVARLADVTPPPPPSPVWLDVADREVHALPAPGHVAHAEGRRSR